MGLPALFPELGVSFSRPPLVPTCEGGASTSAVPEVSSGVFFIVPPPIPHEIFYACAGLRQYRVPEVLLPNGALGFLGDHPDDEVKDFLFWLQYSLVLYIYIVMFSYFCVFSQLVNIRVGDLKLIYTSSLYIWNLLQSWVGSSILLGGVSEGCRGLYSGGGSSSRILFPDPLRVPKE